MSIQESIRFAKDAQVPGALRTALEQVGPGEPAERLSALRTIAKAHGYVFSADDYYHGCQESVGTTSAIAAYTQYGFPYSSFPPIPPPMPS